jgi:alkanesulfonate monooxygenase
MAFERHNAGRPVELFSTCPASSDVDRGVYLRRVAEVARWSERYGYRGILIYTDNRLIDPWLVAQVILQNTEALCPLVAVQPVYAHPYSVAKTVTSLAYLYGRRVYLNMVAGGFRNDLLALDDATPHDRRYDRLVEYTGIIQALLDGAAPVCFEGEFYRVRNLRLTPPLPAGLRPGVFVSGSSEAGLAAARALGATAIQYPRPPEEYGPGEETGDSGIRVGIIARETGEGAWAEAHRRFPPDRRGEIAHQAAMKASDSAWHRQLSGMGAPSGASPYWLLPFQNYKTFCPYLVGSHDRVAEELARYIGAGFGSFILDIPPSEEELGHIHAAFARASRLALASG